MTVIRRIRQVPVLILGNALLFQGVWFSAVLGAAHGHQWWVVLAVAALLGWSLWWGVSWRAEARLLLPGVLLGVLAERLWLSLGLIQYALQPHPLWPPVWILMLWAGFALTLNHSLAWLQGRLWLAATFGALGSVGSVIAGVRLGAAVAPEGILPLALAYGAVWALLVPGLAWWAQRGRHSGGPGNRSLLNVEGA